MFPSDVIFDLHATHTRLSPVFVIGYPRSGTSLTCRLLRRYLKVSFGTESQFIVRYYRRLPRYGDLNEDANVQGLIAAISTERFFQRSKHNWGFRFNREEAFRALKSRTYSGVLEAVFGQLADHNEMVRWGDKTPQYNTELDVLLTLFPDAQFIHVVRDGRDVALSIRQTSFGPTNACQTAVEWDRALQEIGSFTRQLRSNQFYELRYEDLTTAPADMLAALAHYLGIAGYAERVEPTVKQRIEEDIRSNNHCKWRDALAPREVERFEAVAGATLARFGYGLSFHGRARAVSRQERLLWLALARVTRLVGPRSWSDNWHKLSLRARSALPLLFATSLVSLPIVVVGRQCW